MPRPRCSSRTATGSPALRDDDSNRLRKQSTRPITPSSGLGDPGSALAIAPARSRRRWTSEATSITAVGDGLPGQLDQVGGVTFDVDLADTRHVLAAILTIGNEIVSGDTENTNASWLARRLEELGVKVVLSAAVPDELDRIVDFVRREGPGVDHLIVTGGLGGTPDDITREAIAAAFEVPQEIVPEVAADLRSRFTGDPDYVTRWAALPRGAEPLENPLGGAPGFQLRQHLGPARAAERDEGDVRPLRRRVSARSARSARGGGATAPASR